MPEDRKDTHIMALSLDEMYEALKRIHAGNVSLTDLLNLQAALYEEIGIINHHLQASSIAKHKHHCTSKKAGD